MRSLGDFALVLHPPVSSGWGHGEQLGVQDLAAGHGDCRKGTPYGWLLESGNFF